VCSCTLDLEYKTTAKWTTSWNNTPTQAFGNAESHSAQNDSDIQNATRKRKKKVVEREKYQHGLSIEVGKW
jgi:hypothetical protein